VRHSWLALAFLVVWWVGALAVGGITPAAVAARLLTAVQDGMLPAALQSSMLHLMAGLVPAILLGGAAGWLISRKELVKEGTAPMLLALQSIPSIAWLPVATLLLGATGAAVVSIVFIGAWLPMVQATLGGVQTVDRNLLKASRVLGARGMFHYLHVWLPAALPTILVGLRQTWAFAWRSLLAAELLIASPSLGQLLAHARAQRDIGEVLGLLVVIAGVGLFVEMLILGRVAAHFDRRVGRT
jgi:NitT/TauT family transport system permease protein